MSSPRRRARAGGVVRRPGVARSVDDVPVELTDPDHAVWSHAGMVEELADVYGVDYAEPEPSLLRDPYFERFKAFRRCYAERYGFMSQDFANTLDYRRMNTAGIFAGSRGRRWMLNEQGETVRI